MLVLDGEVNFTMVAVNYRRGSMNADRRISDIGRGKCRWNEVEGNGGADFTFTSR